MGVVCPLRTWSGRWQDRASVSVAVRFFILVRSTQERSNEPAPEERCGVHGGSVRGSGPIPRTDDNLRFFFCRGERASGSEKVRPEHAARAQSPQLRNLRPFLSVFFVDRGQRTSEEKAEDTAGKSYEHRALTNEKSTKTDEKTIKID